jgi:hypothetical protein
MLGRALSLATVTLLIGCFAADPAQAQNLEAGKSPSQIFAGTCTACHKGPRGLLKTVPAGSLQGFLRQHYTTSPEMASLLAAFLVSNGAADTRFVGGQPKPAKDEKSEARPGGAPEQLDRFGRRLRPAPPQDAAKPEAEPREAGKPDADGLHGRNARRLARPGEALPMEGQGPALPASERGLDGRKLSAKQKLSKQGKPGSEEPPRTEDVKTDAGNEEPAKSEVVKEDTPKSETAKVEGSKPEGSKLSGEGNSESAKIEVPKATGGSQPPALRADPVPPVTPAPPVSATVSGGTPESAASGLSAASPAQPAPPAVTASVPPPVAPAGPPAPPISQ